MPILSRSFDDRHFVCELPAEQQDFHSGDNRSSLEIFVSAMLTQSTNTHPLPNSIQERALHTINSVWAKLLKAS